MNNINSSLYVKICINYIHLKTKKWKHHPIYVLYCRLFFFTSILVGPVFCRAIIFPCVRYSITCHFFMFFFILCFLFKLSYSVRPPRLIHFEGVSFDSYAFNVRREFSFITYEYENGRAQYTAHLVNIKQTEETSTKWNSSDDIKWHNER